MNGINNDDRLNRSEPVTAKSTVGQTWRSGGRKVSVMTREDAGVDADTPWIASCDEHAEMIGCSTKANAVRAARFRDWCSECRALAATAEETP